MTLIPAKVLKVHKPVQRISPVRSGWSTAGSAAEAMECILAERPDVLVCDIGMQEEDGYSLIRRLRALEKREEDVLPALALSAYARSEDRTKAIRSGFQNHLAKPEDSNH